MKNLTISTKYQIVIPKHIRELIGIRPGMKVRIIPYKDRLEMIPLIPIQKLRGALKGMDTTILREPDRL